MTKKTKLTNQQQLDNLRNQYPTILHERQWIPYTKAQLEANAHFLITEEVNPYEHAYALRKPILDQLNETSDPAIRELLWQDYNNISTTNQWKFTKISYQELLAHPVRHTVIPNTTITIQQAIELYANTIQQKGVNDRNRTGLILSWSRILTTIYNYNQRHINFINSNGSYNHKQIRAHEEHLKTTITQSLKKPLRTLTDKSRDFMELYASRVNYQAPEPNTYKYKEPVRVPADCFVNYTDEQRNDPYFLYDKAQFTEEERNASPIRYIRGNRRVTVKTTTEEIYDLESILWLQQHADQLEDLDGEYSLRKLYDTFYTIEEYLEKLGKVENLIDHRPAPTTVEELRKYQYEDEIIALQDPDYFWENTTNVSEETTDDIEDYMELYSDSPDYQALLEEEEDFLDEDDQPLED